jgi:hypothetical protein
MTTATIQSVNLLPIYFQTDKNTKFLSSTIDQLIQPAQLDRLNSFIGSTSTPTYNVNDSYIIEPDLSRQEYQLNPALVIYDIEDTVKSVVSISDLSNEIKVKGGYVDNFDRLYKSEAHPYYPYIDLDKLNNYQNYFWLPSGSFLIDIDQDYLDVKNSILGKPSATVTVKSKQVTLLNGMLITFTGRGIDLEYQYKNFFVEGTGTSITLIGTNELITPEKIAKSTDDLYDYESYDFLGYDGSENFPVIPEYVTINRASLDGNPWSRYNRWFSLEVITVSSLLNDSRLITPTTNRAVRPIIEFNSNIQLYNFGNTAIEPVDLIDYSIKDAFSVFKIVEGSMLLSATASKTSIVIDGVTVEYGNRVIFAADEDPLIRNRVFVVTFIVLGDNDNPEVALLPASDNPLKYGTSVLVKNGNLYGGSSFWFDGSTWQYSQQHTKINEGPLFDLFDSSGNSYSNRSYYLSNFTGNKIFGYSINGNNPPDVELGLTLDYLNDNVLSSILFKNYFTNDTISIANTGDANYAISTAQTYFKVNDQLANVWQNSVIPKINVKNNGFYEVPLGLINNPLNSNLDFFNLADLTTQKTKTGTQLIKNVNPISFAMTFIGKKENSVINAIAKQSAGYDYFKASLINNLSLANTPNDPAKALDEIILKINEGKTLRNSFFLSDMIGHGEDKIVLNYTVEFVDTSIYVMPEEFSLTVTSNKSMLMYVNGLQLVAGVDYTFDIVDPYVNFLKELDLGDKIKIVFYRDTKRNFIPQTPTKLGLYPSFVPKIYVDNTYTTPTKVIQGHDGSITVAFNDYRDEILLEYELRVFNNLKVSYQSDLFDIHTADPGFWRDTGNISEYSFSEITSILEKDFIKWAIGYGIDYTTNSTHDLNNSFTWNYISTTNAVTGSWRSLFKYYYDTDRPHTHPWEMLGISIKPTWWDTAYGAAPYTSGNQVLWTDISQGKILVTDHGPTINKFYARPNLLTLLPVDDAGNLLDPATIGLAYNPNQYSTNRSWAVGEHGPAETAWRRSSNWPFTVQKLLALTNPLTYCSLMYDPANMKQNVLGQWVYGKQENFLQLNNIPIHGENDTPNASGFSVIISEIGQQLDVNYVTTLRSNLDYANFNLIYKVGGFLDKNTLQIFIDAYEPASVTPGMLLPESDYSLILNTSNPIESIGISGIIIQRDNDKFVVKGYDRDNPYFTYHPSIRTVVSPAITVGGISSDYVNWSASVSSRIFYQKDQIVRYNGSFYRTTISHQAGDVFDTTMFSKMSELPTTGGATVQLATDFDQRPLQLPYGTSFTSIQDLYDLIMGYGDWLKTQGFSFNQFNNDLEQVVDWELSAKEFLYWTTQNWVNNSVISISPFADQLTYQFDKSVVDDIFNKFYEYSFVKSDGTPFDKKNLFITRNNGVFTANTINTDDGMYFARLNSVQKEHVIIFKNTTIFGDIVYDVQTGERQNRMKLVGFKTTNWTGGLSAPGFVYDAVRVVDWVQNTAYLASTVVRYNNFYYSAIQNIDKAAIFDFNKWKRLSDKPTPKLLPNFDYKINQFNDFYSLDIDNFDLGQKRSAQNLIGYWPRPYLTNIISNPISQYKFYQGFIKEKGTANTIFKLSNKNPQNISTDINFYETWALRVGHYGGFTSAREFEFPLVEGTFVENPQIITFTKPLASVKYSPVYYVDPLNFTISPNAGSLPKITATPSTDIFQLINAGYVRIDDVDGTAYNEISLLDIANNGNLLEGNTIWLGFKPDGGWDVLQYTLLTSDIVSADFDTIYNNITISTSLPTGVNAGQIISIVGINAAIDGIYIIQSVISATQFVIINNTAYTNYDELTFPGFIFTFESMRFGNFDLVPSDEKLYRYKIGTYLWIDSGNDTDNKGWEVYKKVLNYSNSVLIGKHSESPEGFGYSISSRNNSDVLVIGAPMYSASGKSGAFSLYNKKGKNPQELSFYSMDNTPGNNNKLGAAVFYDDTPFPNDPDNFGLIFAGAPGAYNNSGTVLISSINNIYESKIQGTLVNPNSNSTGTFGSSIFVQRNTSTKRVLVGAPNINSVYSYVVTANSSSLSISAPVLTTSSVSLAVGAKWGYSIVGSDNAKYVAISAPYNNVKNTNVIVANSSSLASNDIGNVTVIYNSTITQTIYSPFGDNGQFGMAMAMSQDASYLAISAPNTLNDNNSYGAVAIYTNTNGAYALNQILYNVVPDGKMYFGMALSINTASNSLAVTSLGTNTTVLTTFDTITTFDFAATRFVESEDYSGTVYMFNRKKSRFVFGQEINELFESISTMTNFGNSIIVDDDLVFVGAPSTANQNTGSVYTFSKINSDINGWERIRVQDNLVVSDEIKQIRLIDTKSESVISYYDYTDPLKGKILGVADEEITYKESSDPAVYSIGGEDVTVNSNLSWIDQQVGQLWWDLSNAKFIWYEQGEIEYRRNNWGKLFPGASIDIYEWVGSPLLPSDWSALADTPTGLTSGISGQPKYVDNSTISVKQIYDNITGSFSNIYYYWVKNKITIPNVKNRKLSAYSVANYIANPTSAGVEHAAFISSSSLILANFSTKLRSDEVSLNFTIDSTDNKTQQHVEWQLVNEGINQNSIPLLLEKKLFDSLIGYDDLGNLVPDPNLSDRARYGIGIRPQQTLFKNRLSALQNIVNFANGVLINTQVVGNYNFTNLNAEELLPQPTTSSWVTVEDTIDLENIDTTIINKASVIADSYQNGTWAVYQFDGTSWIRVQTQSYNTKLYWDYVDWVSSEYNIYKTISYIISDPYRLSSINVPDGEYVKIVNRGDGKYVIVTPAKSGNFGTFGNNYDVLFIEKGTIQIKDSLWNASFGWDGIAALNQGLFDQTPNKEISYILNALKQDLFINDLSKNWNLLFFKAIKYALAEQPFIDWAFKTSLIDVVSYLGTLTQTPVYKLQDNIYYENYINEVKPYHTKIKRFTAEFENIDNSNTTITDFDDTISYNSTSNQYVSNPIPLNYFTFPESYDPVTGQVNTSSNNTSVKLTTVPWKETTNKMLFDRITKDDQIGNLTVIDNFTGVVGQPFYELSWLAQADKSTIFVSIDGIPVFSSGFTLQYKTKKYKGYNKKYSYLKLLPNAVPSIISDNTGTFNLSITYQKSISLMSAAERVLNLYAPSDYMPKKDLTQLMSGVVDPRKTIGGQYEGRGFGNVNSGMLLDSSINPSSAAYPTWSGSGLINATGIDSSDLIIDGSYNFIPTQANQAPEELVPGLLADSISIDVYTKGAYQTPTIFNGSINVFASTLTQAISLTTMPPTRESMVVTLNGNLLNYVDSTSLFANEIPNQFTIDWVARQLLIPKQDAPGLLSYSIIGVGTADITGVGLIDYQSVSVISTEAATTASIISLARYDDVSTVYVTVDGVPTNVLTVPHVTLLGGKRIKIDVTELTPGNHLIQAWFFNSANAKFNNIIEQRYYSDNTPSFTNDVNGFATGIRLNTVPRYLGSPNSQIIVELIPDDGNRIRLKPPRTTYYTVTNADVTQVSYPIIGSTSSFVVDTVEAKNIQVYLNGQLLQYSVNPANPTLDYYIVNNQVKLTYRQGLNGNQPDVGSTIVIETFYHSNISNAVSITDGSVRYDYDYTIAGAPEIGYTLLLSPNYSNLTNATVRILTFSIQDSLGMVPQTFVGNPNRTYRLDHPVLNSNYLWIEANTNDKGLISLTNGLDYQLLEDHLTILFGANIVLTNSDTVFITSFADPGRSAKTLGYRVTKDFLGKSSFTRLSSADSTYLTKPLTAFDKEIHIADGSILSLSNDDKNIPGVVSIAGERIEFFKNINNVLSQLRRATGGTSSVGNLPAGTIVMDQGINQIIQESVAKPYSDITLIQNTYTGVDLRNTYVISTATISTYVNPITSSTIRCDGIQLTTSTAALPKDPYTGTLTYRGRIYSVSNSSIAAKDQIEVYYGGYLLRKDQSFYHDTTMSYDGISVDQIKGEVATVTALSNISPYVGDAYICTDTDEVWVCTVNQYNIYGLPSYVYSGLRRILPDFTVFTATQQLVLNTATVKLNTGTLLTVVKRQVGSSWNDVISINTNTSLLDSTSTIVKFLNAGPAVLPTQYYYGKIDIQALNN